MVKILHFADAHIDIAKFGQHDPNTGLPIRVMDFLKSLDTIVDTAVREKVDLVIFAGDAYKEPSPAPTFQREWGKRIMRLSQAAIPTILLTGNHDITPSHLRAHAIQEFDTLKVPYVHVVHQPVLLSPQDLDNVPVQVIALPWVTRSGILAGKVNGGEAQPDDAAALLEEAINEIIADFKRDLDPDLPVILAAHASISGAVTGNEQLIKIGKDVQLQPGLVRDPRFDYVALGHIHRYQNLNEGRHPPVIYPGSIERVDFNETNEDKSFIVAEVSKGHTDYSRRILNTRAYFDRFVTLEDGQGVSEKLLAALPSEEEMQDAMVKLTIIYPKDLEPLIDEAELRQKAHLALGFFLAKKTKDIARSRLPEEQETSTLTPLELLEIYWKESHVEASEQQDLEELATRIISDVNSGK